MQYLLLLLVGFAGGLGLAVWLRKLRGPGAASPSLEGSRPDLGHFLELLCRTQGGIAACVVNNLGDEEVSTRGAAVDRVSVERMLSAARLALSDRRRHLIRDHHAVIALGSDDVAVGFTFAEGSPSAERVVEVEKELSRFLLALSPEPGRKTHGWLGWAPGGQQTVEAIAVALCESVRAATGFPCILLSKDPDNDDLSVTAVSQGGDRRMLGFRVSKDSAVARACRTDAPVAAPLLADLLGYHRPDRRRDREGGVAFPVRAGTEIFAALVVLAGHEQIEADSMRRIQALTVEAAGRLSSAIAIRAAERRAMTDHLTGLPNRRALEKAMAVPNPTPASLVILDLDRFKRVNDELGHLAGDFVLKHLSRLLKEALRDGDVAARAGGEEFALWLPGTGLAEASEVAERVRKRIEVTPASWDGKVIRITCSLGVAAYPESVSQPVNLYSLADAALYRAKQGGRNRVELARGPA